MNAILLVHGLKSYNFHMRGDTLSLLFNVFFMSRNEVLRSARKVLDIINSPSKTPSRLSKASSRRSTSASRKSKTPKRIKKKRVPYFLSEKSPSTGSLASASDNLNKFRTPPKHPHKTYQSSQTGNERRGSSLSFSVKKQTLDKSIQTTPALILDSDDDDVELSVEALQNNIYDYQDKYYWQQLSQVFLFWKQRFWTRSSLRSKQNTMSIQEVINSPTKSEHTVEQTATQVTEKEYSSTSSESESDYSDHKSSTPPPSPKKKKKKRAEKIFPEINPDEVINSDPELANLLKTSLYYHNKYCKTTPLPKKSQLVDESKRLLPELNAFDNVPSTDVAPLYREILSK